MNCLPGGSRLENRQLGFSLMEAVVALAIVGVFGSSLLVWLNATISNFEKMTDSVGRIESLSNVLAFASTVNPMQEPEGNTLIPPWSIAWQAEFIPPLAGESAKLVSSYYDVGLYNVRFSIAREGSDAEVLELRLVGYQSVAISP